MTRKMVQEIQVGPVTIGNQPLPVIIAGLCVIENAPHLLQTARSLKQITEDTGFQLIFKASYDKANRTSVESYRGPGIDAGLDALAAVRAETGLPVLTDVHRQSDVEKVAAAVDFIQIPAFLCRQTDFVVAVAETDKPVNVKKGQFLAPRDMSQVIGKIESTGNKQITLTERGASFGYNNLVVDMRGLMIMRELGYPVVFDATHSVQLPGGAGTASGGDRRFAGPLARAAVAVGVDALFLETHENPDCALCDGPNSLAIESLPQLLKEIKGIAQAVQSDGQA